MSYSTCARVAGLIPNLLNGASDFSGLAALGVTTPASAQLINWMSSGCSLINLKLQSLGYGAPVASTSGVYDYLADLEANYAAYRAEAARSSPRIAAGERTRAEQFKKYFDDGLKSLGAMDLTRAGIGYDGAWYVGGISESEIDSVESDTDRVPPRFGRGQFAPDAAS
jgi:hypothetical protein